MKGILSILIIISVFFLVYAKNNPSLSGGKLNTFEINIDRDLLMSTNIPMEWHESIDDKCYVAVYIPKSLHGKEADRVLVIYAAGGRNISTLSVYKRFAEELNFILITPEHRRHDYDDRAHYYYTLRLIEYLKQKAIISSSPSIVLAGFSGGGKVALMIGSYGGDIFDGILAIGVNVDLASKGYRSLANETALNTPIILLNANDDALVQGYTENVILSMKRTGFNSVKHISYTGGHTIPYKQTISSLDQLFRY